MNIRLTPIADLESLQYRLSCGIRTLDILQNELANPIYTTEVYADVIFCIWNYLEPISTEIKECIGQLWHNNPHKNDVTNE